MGGTVRHPGPCREKGRLILSGSFRVRTFFLERARDIQNGSEEYFHSAEWLNIYWSAEEYILIKLCVENKLDALYDEVGRAIPLLLKERFISFSPAVIGDAIRLNQSLIKLPFLKEDLKLELSGNVLDFYHLSA